MTFHAPIRIFNGNPYVHISDARAQALKPGWRKPLPVLVRVNGEPRARPWRINMMPIGGGPFYLYLHGDVRRASKTKVGDRVEVEVTFDEKYRGGPGPMPAWFRAPLRVNAKALTGWKALPPSRQKEMVRYLGWLKSPAARKRNLELALRALSGKPTRYLARSWGGHVGKGNT